MLRGQTWNADPRTSMIDKGTAILYGCANWDTGTLCVTVAVRAFMKGGVKVRTQWNVTKLIAAGSLGVLMLVLNLLGVGIPAVTGIPMSSVINGLVGPALVMISLFVIDQFGALTIVEFVYSIMALPFPLTGTPGFLPKVPIAIVGGLIGDALYVLLRGNKRIASIVIGGVNILYFTVAVTEVGRRLGIPGIERTAELLYSPLVIVAVLIGAIGGYLGWLVYSRIKDTAVVVRIQGE